jgi:hypothetical protein
MGWLVEWWWEEERGGNIKLRFYEPASGSHVRAGLLTLSPRNALDLFAVLASLQDVEVRRSDH